jgi:hypothetical protein
MYCILEDLTASIAKNFLDCSAEGLSTVGVACLLTNEVLKTNYLATQLQMVVCEYETIIYTPVYCNALGAATDPLPW